MHDEEEDGDDDDDEGGDEENVDVSWKGEHGKQLLWSQNNMRDYQLEICSIEQ